MKKLYNLLRLMCLTAIPMLYMLLTSTTIYAQPFTQTVDVTFTSLGGTESGEDNEPVNLENVTCGVANITFEIIEDNTEFGTYITQIRTADAGDAIYTAGDSFTEGVPFILENIQAYGTYDWQIWLHEETTSAPQTATVRVTYEYNQPYVSCNNFTLDLDAGDGSLSANDILNENISCGTSTFSLSKDMFTNSDIGENDVTLTLTDENSLQATCISTVTVVGTPPTECRDTTLQLDAAGAATLTAADVYIGEEEGISPVSLSQTDFTCDDVGAVSVTLTMEDEEGTQTTCTSTVTVADTLKPMVMCQDTVVRLDDTGNFALTTDHVDDGSSDNCGIASMSVSPNAFTAAELGDNTVTLTVEDNNGNIATCESIVTIKKDTDAECKDTTLYLDNAGAATLAAADVLVSTNVENYTLALDKTDFSCADVGTYKNELSVSDETEVSAICYSMVIVMDTTPPMVSCEDLTLSLDASGAASIVEGDIVTSSTDNCGIDETLLSQTDFNCNSSGENLVTVTVTDNSGNQSMCYSTVTVNDDTDPTALCKDITVQLDDNDSYSLEPTEIDNGSSDNCEFIMSVDMPELNCANVGDNTVTLTVTDKSGNISTCESTVTVEDVLAPSLVCEESTIYLRDNGVYVLDREEIRGIAVGADNTNSCASSDFLTVEISQRLFECEDAGMSIPISITATDGIGQVSTCETVINVRDTVSPVVTCVDTTINLYLDENGSASLDAASIMMNDEADSCEPYDMELSQSTFTCEDAGENTVTLTVTDPSNNASTCEATVNVVDTVMACVPETVVDIVVESENHTTLEAAVVAAGLVETLRGEGPFTLFAPTDAAFDALPEGTLDTLLADPTGQLTDILLYHVVAGQQMSSDLSDGQMIETEFGQDVTVTITSEGVFINDAQVTVADIEASNGVVHVIDAVLMPTNTIADIVMQSENHTTLEAALTAAGLVETLEGEGPFTLFAPTDAAFDALPEGALDTLLADPTGQLTDILLYHVVAGQQMSSDLSDGQMIETEFGQDVTVTITSEGVFINDAQVTVADIEASNGVVHVIDAVLMPTNTIADIVMQSENHTTLEAALTAAGLVETLEGEGPFTLFAPTDAAFDALPEGTLDTLLADPTGLLTDILLYHVVAGQQMSSDLSDGQMIETEFGQDVTVTITSEGVFINDAQVTVADIEASNGVVHVIDAVLLPKTNTVADIVIESENHTALEAALTAAGLVETLQGEGPFTVFAPTDAAFDALFEELGVTSLDEIDSTTLDAVLKMHVVSGTVMSSDITEGMTATTLFGEDITFSLEGGPMIMDPNGRVSNITDVDIEAQNGVVHVIDSVILPESNPTNIRNYNEMSLKIYPNPTRGLVNIDFATNEIHDVDVAVVDITGRQVLRKQFSATDRISFDLKENVSGMYFVKLDFGGKYQVVKKIILDKK